MQQAGSAVLSALVTAAVMLVAELLTGEAEYRCTAKARESLRRDIFAKALELDVGNMGSRLSGGEKQRIGIAHTMITDPDVIVMDEPTSSLDILHEKELLKTLREQCADKMILIVSHRPSTLTDCTSVVRLENGKGTKEAVK